MNQPTNTRSSTGLLPCPFCGSVDLSMLTYSKTEDKPQVQYLQCNCCLCTGPWAETESQVRVRWDVRATPV